MRDCGTARLSMTRNTNARLIISVVKQLALACRGLAPNSASFLLHIFYTCEIVQMKKCFLLSILFIYKNTLHMARHPHQGAWTIVHWVDLQSELARHRVCPKLSAKDCIRSPIAAASPFAARAARCARLTTEAWSSFCPFLCRPRPSSPLRRLLWRAGPHC